MGNIALKGSVDPSSLIKVKTIDGAFVRVLQTRYQDSAFHLLSCYTIDGKRKARPVHRSNLMNTNEDNATESYRLELALRKSNKVVIATAPRSAKRERELYKQGFFPVRKSHMGLLVKCSLGLVWIKTKTECSLESIEL